MRICLFTPSFFPVIGGVEYFTDMLARGMIARGHEVVVIAQIMKSSTPLWPLPYPVRQYRRPPMQHLWAEILARPLVRAWRQYHFDIVLTNYGYPLGYAVSRVKQRLNVGLISIAHGSDLHSSFNPKNKLRANRLRQLGYERSDQVVGVSRTMAERVREVIGEAPTPIEVVHNGIDLENWRREQEAARTGTAEVAREFQLAPGGFTLQVGALRTVKRPDVAIRAVARARDSYDRLNLTHVMVGEGKLGADYRTLAGELGISDRIVFAGNRTGTDKAWLFAHARFLVHTSDDEGGLPLVLSEAAASGLPLLVSDIPSHQDFVADSGCGRLFRKGDPDDLARGMRAMLEGDLGRMRAASLERSKNFSWNTTLDAYERLCKKVIGLVQPGKQAR